MQVLEVTQRYAPAIGGVERHISQLVGELRRGGCEVEVCTTDLLTDRPFARLRGGRPPDDLPVRRHRAVRWMIAPHGLGIAAPGMLRELLGTRADVVHAHAFGYPPTWFGALGASLRRRPLVVTTHSDAGAGTRRSAAYSRLVARATLRAADRVIALTQGEARRLEGLGIPPARLAVVPNGLDLAEFPPSGPPPPRDGVRALFVGRIYTEQKGLDVLIDALAGLADVPQLKVRLVGEDWASWTSLEARARARGVAGRVEYLGRIPRDRLLAEYLDCDLLVLPSRFDSFPIVLLEAMASGRPIVATAVGGVPEVVRDGATGLIVPPGDAAALAEALRMLATSPELRRRLGDRGREVAREYDWRRLGPRVQEVLSEARSAAG